MAAVSPQRAATEHGLDTRIPGGGEKKKRTNNQSLDSYSFRFLFSRERVSRFKHTFHALIRPTGVSVAITLAPPL
jgi:hypothetical protein